MQRPRTRSAFSLIEVVLAVALVAVAVVAVIGLLSGLARQSVETEDTQTALRLPDAVTGELRALATQRGFDGLEETAPVMSAATDEGLLLVAARDGSQLRVRQPVEAPAREQYFLIEVRKFRAAPLAFQPGMAALPLNVRVSWPYRQLTPDGLTDPLPFASRQNVNFNVAINR